jgi:KaiC/GvpD/RAD55 family RecA-like ATPase
MVAVATEGSRERLLKRMKSIYGEFFVRAIREQRANAAIIDC